MPAAEAVCHKRRIKVGSAASGFRVLKGSSSNPAATIHPIETGRPCRPGGNDTRIHCSANGPGERAAIGLVGTGARSPGPGQDHGGLQMHRRIVASVRHKRTSNCSLVASKGLIPDRFGANGGKRFPGLRTDPVARGCQGSAQAVGFLLDKSGQIDSEPLPRDPAGGLRISGSRGLRS